MPLAAARAVIFAQMVDDPSAYVDTLRADPKLKRNGETALKARLKLWEEARELARKAKGTNLAVPEPGPQPTLDEMLADLERQRLFRIIEDLVLWENTTNETVLYGLGELHLRMLLERPREVYKFEVDTAPPRIAYRESVTALAEGHHRHKKQSGGAGQFGEVFLRIADVRGFWGYFLPLDLTMSTSMIYELIEWGAATTFGDGLGQSYLGTQGDVWDAHKDMALASLGAVIAMGVTALINARLQRDFAREFADSLRVKGRRPLGEDEIARRLDGLEDRVREILLDARSRGESPTTTAVRRVEQVLAEARAAGRDRAADA